MFGVVLMARQKFVFTKIPASVVLLRMISILLPTDFLRTFFYLNFIQKPRKFLRTMINSFYRMDHIYDVIGDCTKNFKGDFSVLEFGVAAGYTYTKMLYATKYLKVADRVTVHGFDSFEGMPRTDDRRDMDIVTGDNWAEGQFESSYEELDAYCSKHYNNYRLHKGMFDETLTDELLEQLRKTPPILIWMDCDYYTSSKAVMEKLIPVIPNGCVIYFDEPEFNYGSRYTGEMRIIHEINAGEFGEGIELVLDRELSLNTYRIYRFINEKNDAVNEPYNKINSSDYTNRRTNDSPLP